MRLKSCLAAILTALICACGGGGGGNGSGNGASGLQAPSQLAVTPSGQDQITLTWVAPSGAFDGYELEGKIGSDPFVKLHTGLIPNDYIGLYLSFSSTAPDNTTYTFRLRSAKGAAFSPYTNEAPYSRGPNAPGQATAIYDSSTSLVNLAWDRNTSGSDGLLIERAECTYYGSVTGPWVPLSAKDPLASSYVDAGVSPNVYYAYRLTNLLGTRSGQASTPSSPVFTGLISISWVNAYYDVAQAGVQVSWGSFSSTTADGILLERSDCDANGASLGNWTALSLPTGYRTSFMDLTMLEGGRYLYRASNLYGSKATTPCQANYSVSIPLLAPINLQAIATAGGVQLTWQNRSQAANQVVVRRTPAPGNSSDIAILSSSTTTYLDAPASLGYYSYTVVAKNSSDESSSSPVVTATLNPPDALALKATLLNLPSASDAALRPTGSWAFATTSPFGILSNNDPWTATFPSNAGRYADPIIQVDRQGWPHVVYATVIDSGGASDLIHLWYDGTVWQSEVMVKAKIPFSSANQGFTYRLDSTGMPHVLLDHATTSQPYGGATASLSYLHKVNGNWMEEPLSGLAPAINNIGTYHLRLEDTDTPHILLGNWSSVVDYVRTGSGTWPSTTVPTGTVNAGWYDFIDSLWVDGNNGWIFYENYVSSGNALSVIQMKNGVWQPPQSLGTRDFNGSSTAARCAISPDRSRVAILYATGAGFKIYHQAPDGWHETLVAPSSTGWASTMRIGFDGVQKAHVLLSTGSGYTDLHE